MLHGFPMHYFQEFIYHPDPDPVATRDGGLIEFQDLLYQTYVRKAKLQAALRLRQFPVDAAAANSPPAVSSRSAER